jgi:bacteriorhodopsin
VITMLANDAGATAEAAATVVATMPDLSPTLYNVVYNIFSLTVATMGASAVFFFFAPRINRKYRPAMIVTGLVTLIAFYHYWQIRDSWAAAYSLEAGTYVFSGAPFNDFYRYADWLLTVPLLMVELVAVMALTKSETRKYLTLLIPLVVLMIATGYPGENAISTGGSQAAIWGWFIVSMIFFVGILAVLFTKLTDAINKQPEEARPLINAARVVVLITWSFYPIAYLIGALGGSDSPGAVVGLNIGYAIADITAKAGFGVFIYFIARAKSEAEGLEESPSAMRGTPAPA